ncbi:F-box/kelch-repeat protein [Raphanus sativus]|uniref:F-box/kelch-repeat protein At4g38940-like n=1 Tax=Raphanus sativus TaxID=3726 RepID=A0A6J0JNF2_RAPSA|nr:F-box/kelch-repeat protein At4g38940-like [Raphanus sativus]KAJ4891636.1 F-box/kelch-repeat protein [Raphanus sativus]
MSSKTRSKNKVKSSEPPSLIPSLPEDIIVDILARVGRCYYPKLSLVSKHFRSLVTSHELYSRRLLLGCTEHCLYVVLCNRENYKNHCYVLCRKANGNHSLVLIPSFSNYMPRKGKGGFVAVGSRIYVFGRLNATSIDCRSQTVHLLPSMNVTMSVSVADIIDGKIYVSGCCNNQRKMVMTVFNTETQMWEPKKTAPETLMSDCMWPGDCVVLAGKMYMQDDINSFVFEPKESKWETEKTLNMFRWKDECVVDDVLYYYDCVWEVLRAYDPKESGWLVVNGLEELLAQARFSDWSYTGSYGRKLVLFFWKMTGKTRVIRCAEISLERRQEKEIWGKSEWCDDVLVGGDFFVRKSLDVIV